MPNNEDKWESGELGATEAHAKAVSPKESDEIDDALGLQPITIRFQKGTVDELKRLAKLEGLGYQPLIRQMVMNSLNELRKKHSATYPSDLLRDSHFSASVI